MTSSVLNWLSLTVEEFARWGWQQRIGWPDPLSSSAVGQFELPLEEILGETPSPVTQRSRGEERLLESVADVLWRPAYSAFAIRGEAGRGETYSVAVVGAEEAILLVVTADQVRISRVEPTAIAESLVAQLPKVLAAPTIRMEVAAQTASLLAGGFERNAPQRTLRSAMSSAGIPDVVANRLLAPESAVLATGTLAAMSYETDPPRLGTRSASWTEMADGGMVSSLGRGGEVIWEPMSPAVMIRVVADTMASLGSR
ncbi:EspG family protein [Frankineae bacterium MT45]|nr:EspG family protein [Frankineae bacterium MT45]